jgi:hypothetical protein
MSSSSNPEFTVSVTDRGQYGAVRRVRAKAEGFLATSDETLTACTNCRLALLCGAVAARLSTDTSNLQGQPDFYQSHGIEYEQESGKLCPKRLIETAQRSLDSGQYWIARDDPANFMPPDLQLAETIRQALEDLSARQKGGQAI